MSDITTALAPYQAQPQIIRADSDEQMIGLWLATKRNSRTAGQYIHAIRQFRESVTCPLRVVTLNDLLDYCEGLSALQPSTQGQRIAIVKSLFSFAHKVGYLPVNVAATIRPPQHKETLSERILSEQDVLALMIAARSNPRNELLIRMLYRTGGRISEILAATWSDFLLREDIAQITVYGKGGKTRHIALPVDLYHAVQMLRNGAGDSDKIFPITRQRAWVIVKSVAKRAGVTGKVSPHWFRHSHATHALDHDADLKLVQATLGHAGLDVTSRYLHVRPGESSGLALTIG